jgi:pimeloyl-ACP methyl ester carboxylesterase
MPFIENEGVKIHYKVEGNGPALILIHGGVSSLDDWYDMEYVAKFKDDYQLILVDLRGHGQSDAGSYTFDLFTGDILKVLDEVGVDKFHIAGFSFGGWFVYGVAEKVPDRILSMIVLDGVPGVNDGEGLRQLLADDKMFAGLASIFPDSIRERLLKVDRAKYMPITDFATREAPSVIKSIKKFVKTVKFPCLVITSEYEEGSEDFELLKLTADSIPGSTLITKAGFSHPEILIRSDEIIAHVKEFLDGLK